MIQTGQIIFYDSSKMMCFDVTHFMVKEPEKQMIETTFIGDEERHFIQLTPEPICMFIETGEEIVKLDPRNESPDIILKKRTQHYLKKSKNIKRQSQILSKKKRFYATGLEKQ